MTRIVAAVFRECRLESMRGRAVPPAPCDLSRDPVTEAYKAGIHRSPLRAEGLDPPPG